MADDPEFVGVYSDMLQDSTIRQYTELSKKIGGVVGEQADLVQRTLHAQLAFLRIVGDHKQPAPATLQKLLAPTSDLISSVVDLKDKNRAHKLFNHLSTVSESISALGWVAVGARPGSYVKEMTDAGQFYGNRVVKEYKGVDESHVTWMRSWMQFLQKLHDYVVDFHRAGLTWNAKGKDASSVHTQKGGPPPPVPPQAPLAPPTSAMASASISSGGDRSQLFSAINKGTEVTRGLKKVSDDMKTHKNPNLRQGGVVTATKGAAPPSKPVAPQQPVTKTPIFTLDGKKWLIENQVSNHNMKLEDVNMKQTVYMYRCVDSMLQLSGKVNSVIVDSCKKVAIVLDDLVSGLEFVNCQSVKCQVMGKVPTISIDKTDGCEIYLSKESLQAEIVTAKSSEMNVLVPGGNDFTEHALPEQFKSTWDGRQFVTMATDINK